MKMTFRQYIDNPLGKENSVFSHRELYKNLYLDKLSKILVREAGKVLYKLYYDRKRDRYYTYIKVPSEVIANFYYDTVIEFYTTDKQEKKSGSLKGYEIKFFSNDPSFIFTFAYAFNKRGLLIDDLKSKIPKKALTTKAEVRNPKALVGYVKSIYFGFLIMNRYSLFAKMIYKVSGYPYNKTELLSQIMDGSKKIDLRVKADDELKKLKRIEKQKKTNEYNANRKITRIKDKKSVNTDLSVHSVNKSKIIQPISKTRSTLRDSIGVKVTPRIRKKKRF